MIPRVTHYGVPGRAWRAACGSYRQHVSTDRTVVTCQLCRRTGHYRNAWYDAEYRAARLRARGWPGAAVEQGVTVTLTVAEWHEIVEALESMSDSALISRGLVEMIKSKLPT